jgi:hypothetical protein
VRYFDHQQQLLCEHFKKVKARIFKLLLRNRNLICKLENERSSEQRKPELVKTGDTHLQDKRASNLTKKTEES